MSIDPLTRYLDRTYFLRLDDQTIACAQCHAVSFWHQSFEVLPNDPICPGCQAELKRNDNNPGFDRPSRRNSMPQN